MTWPTQTHNHPWPESNCPECQAARNATIPERPTKEKP